MSDAAQQAMYWEIGGAVLGAAAAVVGSETGRSDAGQLGAQTITRITGAVASNIRAHDNIEHINTSGPGMTAATAPGAKPGDGKPWYMSPVAWVAGGVMAIGGLFVFTGVLSR